MTLPRHRRGMAATAMVWLLLAGPLSAQRNQKTPVFDTGPYDIKNLKLGKLSTAIIVLGADTCKDCIASMSFYKSLMKLPAVDGSARRVVVVAMDGVWPVKNITDAHGFTPHHLTSGPYRRRTVAGITKAPTILVVDGKGAQRGKWAGALTAAQQKEIIAALNK